MDFDRENDRSMMISLPGWLCIINSVLNKLAYYDQKKYCYMDSRLVHLLHTLYWKLLAIVRKKFIVNYLSGTKELKN